MKMKSFFLGCFAATALGTAASALTVNIPVTPAYLQEHPKEFSVKVAKDKNGLLAFTVVRTLREPRYLVAHLTVNHGGVLIVESHTPSYGKKHDNTFYFSVSPDDVGECKFELGESFFTEAGGDAVPMPGTSNYQFQLQDFVTKR